MWVCQIIQLVRPELTIGKFVSWSFSGSKEERKQFGWTGVKAAHRFQSMECIGSVPADWGAFLQPIRGKNFNFNIYIVFHIKAPKGGQRADGNTVVGFSAAHKIRNQSTIITFILFFGFSAHFEFFFFFALSSIIFDIHFLFFIFCKLQVCYPLSSSIAAAPVSTCAFNGWRCAFLEVQEDTQTRAETLPNKADFIFSLLLPARPETMEQIQKHTWENIYFQNPRLAKSDGCIFSFGCLNFSRITKINTQTHKQFTFRGDVFQGHSRLTSGCFQFCLCGLGTMTHIENRLRIQGLLWLRLLFRNCHPREVPRTRRCC